MGKYCSNCGQPLEDDARFCNKCGHEQTMEKTAQEVKEESGVEANVEQKNEPIPQKPVVVDQETETNWGKIIMFGIMAIITGVIIYGFSTGAPHSGRILEDKYVKAVKGGTLEMAPNHPIGSSFEKFFGDCKWKSFESTDKRRIVEFNGNCKWEEKPAKCSIQFIMNGTSKFELGAVAINDVSMNRLQSLVIVRKALGALKDDEEDEEAPEAETVEPNNQPQAQNTTSSKKFGYLKDGDTNFRSEPNTDSKVIDVFDDQEMVEILGQQGEWYKVKRQNGQTGWAFAEYVLSEPRSKTPSDGRENSKGVIINDQYARRTVNAFYTNLNNKRFSDAYSMFSSDWKSQINYDSWKNGYADTVSQNVNITDVEVQSNDLATVYFTLNAKDKQGNQTVTSSFKGQWDVIIEKGRLVLDNPSISKN